MRGVHSRNEPLEQLINTYFGIFKYEPTILSMLKVKDVPVFSAPAAGADPVLPGEAGGGVQRGLGPPSPPVPPHLLHT